MNFDEQHDLAAAYALGALSADEATAYEAHLDNCERCRREVMGYSDVVEQLADAEAVQPPPQLRSLVLDEVARTPQSPAAGVSDADPIIDLAGARARRVESRPARLLLAAAAALVFVVGGAATLLALGDDDTYESVAAAADAETLQLESDLGTVTVVYSPDEDRVGVSSTGLPDPGEGKTYELWLVVADGVIPAGLFVPEAGDVRRAFAVEDAEPDGFGITIEPEGGSEQPTGEILFIGTFET